MIPSKMILVAAAAIFALTAFESGGEARAENRGYHAYCQWHKQQAMRSGDECMWERWRRCVRGNLWHDDMQCPDPRAMQQQRRDGGLLGRRVPYGQ